jgi:hypothetical protein
MVAQLQTRSKRPPRHSRRTWLKQAVGVSLGWRVAFSLPSPLWAQGAGANSDIRIAVLGTRLRGAQLIAAFKQIPGVRIVALCDVDSEVLAEQKQKLASAGIPVEALVDFRRILDRKDIDAVVIATPDHWHAHMTVSACQAGKDVYVEKPVSHNIWEGRKMVEAARKYHRVVQAGTQNRSDAGLQQAAEFMRQGGLGEIKLARVFDYVRRESMGKVDCSQPVPKTVDYDLFMGPAPLEPLRRKNLHYDWHFVWPTGTGDCGNRGVHTLDHARWMIGQETIAPRVLTIAGRCGWEDDGETPNSQITFFDCQPVPMLFELRSLPSAKGSVKMDSFRGIAASMIIECEHGYLTGGRGGARAFSPQGKVIRQFKGDGGVTHPANFIAAMRSRRVSDLRADILQGRVSTNFCHLANVSYRVGRRREPMGISDALKEQPLLRESFERIQQHLTANEVDLTKAPLTVGPMLAFDSESERFTGEGSQAANRLLQREYRPPFVIAEV